MASPSNPLNKVSQQHPPDVSQAHTDCAVRETYLSHPILGLLINLCIIALYTSLDAKRLFFLVTAAASGLAINSISRHDVKILLEKRLAVLQYSNFHNAYQQVSCTTSQTL